MHRGIITDRYRELEDLLALLPLEGLSLTSREETTSFKAVPNCFVKEQPCRARMKEYRPREGVDLSRTREPHEALILLKDEPLKTLQIWQLTLRSNVYNELLFKP
jgi:hypothetical protein